MGLNGGICPAERAYYLDAFANRFLVFGAERPGDIAECEDVATELSCAGVRVLLICPGKRQGDIRDGELVDLWRRMLSGQPACLTHVDPFGCGTSIAERCRVHKLVLIGDNLVIQGKNGRTRSFVNVGATVLPARLRALARVLQSGVDGVNLVAPGGLAEELFTYAGSGTLLTWGEYGEVRRVGFRDYVAVAALLRHGCDLGYLRPRSPDVLERILPRSLVFFADGDHPAGVVALQTEPYQGSGFAELEALFTISRYQGEGVGRRLVSAAVEEAREDGLDGVFAVTMNADVAGFFVSCGFVEVLLHAVPAAKWEGYPQDRRCLARAFRVLFSSH